MDDLITLTCPSCGGKLTVQKDATTYVCDYCGQSHRLRAEDIEAFSRCPLCHRNDKVEKLTSIRKRQDKLAQAFSLPEVPPYVIAPLHDPKNPGMVKPFGIETKTRFTSRKSKIGNICLYTAVILFIIFIILISNNPEHFLAPLFFLLLFLASLVFGIINSIKGKLEEKHVQKAIAQQIPHEAAKTAARYNSIYYCQRDDVIFIPGEEGAAPSAEYARFLYKPLIDEIMKVGLYPEQKKIWKRS